MTKLFGDPSRAAFAEGIRTGAERAGIRDAAKIRTLQSEVIAKHWDDLKAEAKLTPTEARTLGADFIEHAIDHQAGRNTPEKLERLRAAAWQGERSRQRSNTATAAKFKATDDWAKDTMPNVHALLKNGVGNRPSVTRALLDRHTAATRDASRKGRSASYIRTARDQEAAAAVAAAALRSGGMLGGDPDEAA